MIIRLNNNYIIIVESSIFYIEDLYKYELYRYSHDY